MTGKKLNLAYISKDSVRKKTLANRKRGLLKKLDEIKILCGVDACAVIYSPYNSTPEVWPSISEANKVMDKFQRLPEEKQKIKSVNHGEFLTQRITKVRKQVQRLNEDNNDTLMNELMISCLNGNMGASAINDSNRGNLCEFIDGCLKKLYHYRKVTPNYPHLETGESSSMAMAMNMPPIAMAEAGSSSFFNSPQLTNEFQPLLNFNYGPEHISSHGGQSLNVPTFNFPQQTNEVQLAISSNQGQEHVHSLGNSFTRAPIFNSSQLNNEWQPLVTSNEGVEHNSSHGSQFLNVPTFNFSQQTNEVHPTISSNQGLEHVHSLGNSFMRAPIFNSPQLTNEWQPLVTSNEGLEDNSSHGNQFLDVPTFNFSQQTNEVQPTISSNQGLEHVHSLGNNFMNAPIFSPPQLTNEIQQPIISSNQETNQVDSLASNLLPFSNHGVNTQVMNQDEVYYPLNQQDWYDEEMMKQFEQACFPWMEENNHYNHHQL